MRYAKIISKEELNDYLKDQQNLLKIPLTDYLPNMHCIIGQDEIIINPAEENEQLIYTLISIKAPYETYPIYFYVYMDESDHLRAYVPQRGNIYNPWTLSAFGDESVYDNSQKSISNMPPQFYKKKYKYGSILKETSKYKKKFEHKQLIANKDLMLNEFLHFVKVRKDKDAI